MKRLVNYLLSDVPCGPYLTVSLMSLRDFYRGPVRVHAWARAEEMARRIAADDRLGEVEVVVREARWRGRDDYLFDKIDLMMGLDDYEAGILFDADTLITGPVEELFRGVEEFGFVATQFNQWTTRGPIMQRRIKNLRRCPEVDQELVEDVLRRPYPAFNVGVFASNPKSPVLPEWYEWTMAAKWTFIGDEVALQPLQVKHVPKRRMVVADGRFNHSPKVEPARPVHVWHGHGNCFTKEEKSPVGVSMWYPLYRKAVEENLGGIAEWKDHCKHRWTKRLERAKRAEFTEKTS